jgi:hypothetical protein
MSESSKHWWGEFKVQEGATANWEIGPLRIAVQRYEREWYVGHERIETPDNPQEWRFSMDDSDLSLNEFADVSRLVYEKAPEKISVLPALADRSVVSRPFTPFTVPVKENATVYISTPVWFTLATGSPLQTLFETPIQRPSDTWFGSSTLEGETCYASKTRARLNLENLTLLPYRAMTTVNILNNATVPLLIERLNIPVPFLSLFQTKEGILWTEAVTVINSRPSALAEFNIDKEPPPQTASGKLVSAPRQDPQKGMLIRAFSVLKLQGFD